ncbi:MAG: hypothetical protein J7K33_09855 [Candidatus Marinimicrobia bacterium]|nr:hypothetical protein [Candidatus Neomarinimicrobiota bacterium]
MIISEDELKPGELPVNKIVHGDALTVLKKFPSNSVDCEPNKSYGFFCSLTLIDL